MKKLNPSEYYDFLFPEIGKTTRKDWHYVFSEYGCMEAINVEYDDHKEDFVFTAKKQKPLIDSKGIVDHNWFYWPNHHALPFGEPETLTKLCNVLTANDIDIAKLVPGTYFSDNQARVLPTVPNIEEQQVNFMIDHPDAAQGTFLELFSHYFPFFSKEANILPDLEAMEDIGTKLPKHFMPKYQPSRTKVGYPSFVDPFMFDIPQELLNNLLAEEIEYQNDTLLYDSSYAGGAMACKTFDCRKNCKYGVLFRPGGKAMNELSFQLFCTCPNEKLSDDMQDPKLILGSDYRFSLNGRILQIDAQSSFQDERQYLVGTRSLHHVLLSAFDSSGTAFELSDSGQYSKLYFSSEDCVNHLGVFQTSDVVTSMCVSPYIDGECIIALDNGAVLLWDSVVHSDVNQQNFSPFTTVREATKAKNKWQQVQFSSHPRQIFIADRNGLQLLDLRGKGTFKQLYEADDGDKTKSIMSFLSGTNFDCPNEFQYLTATSCELKLCDIRHRGVSLLSWALNLKTPCQHLAVVGSPLDGACFDLNSVILATSHQSQEMQMYQYNLKSRPKDVLLQTGGVCQSLRPPVSTATPLYCETFKDVQQSLSGHMIRSHGHVIKRLSYPIVGVTGFGCKTSHGGDGLMVIQVSACGDVLCQPFHLQEPVNSWNETHSTSGLVPSHSQSAEAKQRRKEEAAAAARLQWASKVCSNYRNTVVTESRFDLRSSRSTINSFKFSLKKKAKSKKLISLKSSSAVTAVECDRCDVSSTHSNDAAVCDCNALNHRVAVDCHREGVFHPSHLNGGGNSPEFCSTVETSYNHPKVDRLNLVDIQPLPDGLGRVLVTTWDGSYEELWDAFESESTARKLKADQQLVSHRFDITPVVMETERRKFDSDSDPDSRLVDANHSLAATDDVTHSVIEDATTCIDGATSNKGRGAACVARSLPEASARARAGVASDDAMSPTHSAITQHPTLSASSKASREASPLMSRDVNSSSSLFSLNREASRRRKVSANRGVKTKRRATGFL